MPFVTQSSNPSKPGWQGVSWSKNLQQDRFTLYDKILLLLPGIGFPKPLGFYLFGQALTRLRNKYMYFQNMYGICCICQNFSPEVWVFWLLVLDFFGFFSVWFFSGWCFLVWFFFGGGVCLFFFIVWFLGGGVAFFHCWFWGECFGFGGVFVDFSFGLAIGLNLVGYSALQVT